MKISNVFLFLLFVNFQTWGQSALKEKAHAHIAQLTPMLLNLKDSIGAWAEPSLQEYKTKALLQETLSKAGFQIEENLGGIPSMFSARYGQNGPSIALLGEYDADVFEDGTTGHASGHHWLGVGSLGAALSLKQLIDDGEIEARIVYVGSTAEGGFGGRAHLARRNVFKGIDLAIFWHPSPVTWASTRPWDALLDLEIQFKQAQVKAIGMAPNSATLLQKVLHFTGGLDRLKMGIDSTIHLHYSLATPKSSYNYTAGSIGVKIRIQAVEQAKVHQLYQAVKDEAEDIRGNGIAVNISIFRAIHAFLPNNTGMQLVAENMDDMGPIPFSIQEQDQAKAIQGRLGLPTSGLQTKLIPFQPYTASGTLREYASDIGDVSWWAPTLSFVSTCYPRGVPIGQGVAAELAFQSFGGKGMLYAAKLICSSVIDYLANKELRHAIKAEFQKRIGAQSYHFFEPMIPPTVENNRKRTK